MKIAKQEWRWKRKGKYKLEDKTIREILNFLGKRRLTWWGQLFSAEQQQLTTTIFFPLGGERGAPLFSLGSTRKRNGK